ncbi:hypothetical protein [Roseomonas indoligenes]|uniref:Uncharacterized protein n=1 Tax=Roseomonas indoligenes TaxID=2820811 RepID=A0A940MWK6_9PROT|nr:hypothetical protein [Pararoseomonas indoligenes]MBP0492144.1 hypothetical protein [Pararoseomonas indoligenes]
MAGVSFSTPTSPGNVAFAAGFEPEVTRGLRAWHFMTGGQASAIRNQWRGDGSVGDALVTGAPNFLSDRTQFQSGVNYLSLRQQTDALNGTIIGVFRTLDTLAATATRPAFFGHYATGGGTTSGGVQLVATAATSIVGYVGVVNSGTTTAVAGALTGQTPATWAIYSLRWRSGVDMNARNESTGLSAVTADTRPRFVQVVRTQRIGDGLSGNYGGTSEAAMFAGYSDYLTDAELAAVLTRNVRPFLGTVGITA